MIYSLPWDQRTLIGYVGEIIFVVFTSSNYMICNAPIILLFISICLHHQAFYKIFQHSLNKLDLPDKNINNRKFICDLVRFHTSVTEYVNLKKKHLNNEKFIMMSFFFSWFSYTANVYSLFIVILLICNTINLSCALFQLDAVFIHF